MCSGVSEKGDIVTVFIKEVNMRIKSESVRNWVFAYLALPNLIFMIGWLRWEISLPAIGFLMAAMICIWRGNRSRDVALEPLVQPADSVYISKRSVFVLVSVVVLWCIMAGQGGFVVQATDWHWRNATFRDLITHKWPVRYDDFDRALVFYVGHWLPAAVIGKVVLGATGDLPVAWRIGNVALLFWTSTGVVLTLVQMFLLMRANTTRRLWALFVLLVCWGGLDALGACFVNMVKSLRGHIPDWWFWWDFGDWWMSNRFNYTSNSTCLFWVFHQAVPGWIAIMFVARGLNVSEAAFLGSLLLINCPLPATGIVFVVCVLALHRVCSGTCGLIALFRSGVSFPNLIGLLIVAPLIAGFVCSNPASGNFSFAWTEKWAEFSFLKWILFFGCELGLYFFVTFRNGRSNVWWWCALIWLVLCPLVVIDGGPDFCMRASIPLLMALSVLVFRALLDPGIEECRWRRILTLVCVVAGAYVPVKEIVLFSIETMNVGVGEVKSDRIVSFDKDLEAEFSAELGKGIGDWIVGKCNVRSPDGLFFYRYLAKRRDEADAKSGGGRKD